MVLAGDRRGEGGPRRREAGLLVVVVVLLGAGGASTLGGAVGVGVLGGDEADVLVGVAVGALPGELAAAAALLGVAAHPGGRLAVAAVVRGDLVRVPALLAAVHRRFVWLIAGCCCCCEKRMNAIANGNWMERCLFLGSGFGRALFIDGESRSEGGRREGK